MTSKCVVCATDFDHTAKLAYLTCGHHFHRNCLTQWIARNRACPTCRRRASLEEVHEAFFVVPPDLDPHAEAKERAEKLRKELLEKEQKRNKLWALYVQLGASIREAEDEYRQKVAASRMAEGPSGKEAKLRRLIAEARIAFKKRINDLIFR